MDNSALAPWRDLAIVWFALWMMIFVALPGVVFFFAQKYLRRFNHWLKMPFLNAQVWALRIQYATQRVSQQVADGVIRAHSRGAQASTTARGVIDYLRGK